MGRPWLLLCLLVVSPATPTAQFNSPLRIFSASWTFLSWYAATRLVMATIWGSFLYLLVSLPRIKRISSRLSLLGVERVDTTPHEHICQYKVFEDLYTLRRTGFIVLPERLEQVGGCVIPWTYLLALHLKLEKGTYAPSSTFYHRTLWSHP